MSEKDEILQMLYQNKISAREALGRIKQLSNKNGSTMGHEETKHAVRDIAVIGMSGMFPEAKNTGEFWENLQQGRDSVKEIARWDLDSFYDGTGKDNKKSYSKWGGFLSDIDFFDPIFFELSPKQAELMEPRQRLFLLESWKTFEDAGYSKDEVNGSKCGIFVGCEGSTEYFDKMKKESMNAHVFLGHSNSVLASRIAYIMNLKGPCVTVDTACSSSLVAIHLACESLQSGACDIALAGGVNVMTSPGGYVLLSSMNALSYTGKCRAFDDGADGFVPGEAVGAILLKPLEQAKKDRDHIYAVIKASMVNQDGRTNGIMAPSSLSQANLEREVYRLANISPETISYIEAHGTGTKLGDPIEVNALKAAFGDYTKKKQFCGIGSVKSNIGHASAASGIASMIKVLLSIQNHKLVPSLHYERENSHLNLADSPFYVVDRLMEWECSRQVPRRAAVSSFGHGGTNCHILLEELQEQKLERKLRHGKHGIVLSAKTEESLLKKADDLVQWMQNEGREAELSDIAYTLAAGREHFSYRIGFLCESRDEMMEKLSAFREHTDQICICEKMKPEELNALNRKAESLVGDLKQQNYPELLMQQMMDLYLKGTQISWKSLFDKEDVKRIAMPTYPFQLHSYWIPDELLEDNEGKSFKALAPLVDGNESTLNEICYSKHFTGEEFFLKDHMKMLPAVVYMEMVRQAGVIANTGKKVTVLNNFVWANPILVGEGGKDVFLYFSRKENGTVDVKIMSKDGEARELHAQGILGYGAQQVGKRYAVGEIKERCRGGREIAQEFYEYIQSNDVRLGERFRGMISLYFNEKEALAELAIPEVLEADFSKYQIHPTLTDGGFQTVINWAYHTGTDKDTIYLPFVMEELDIYEPQGRVKYAYATKNPGGDSYNIVYLSEDGNALYQAKKFSFKAMTVQDKMLNGQYGSENETLYYHMQLVEAEYETAEAEENTKKTILFDDDCTLLYALKDRKFRDIRLIDIDLDDTKRGIDEIRISDNQEAYDSLFEKEVPDQIIYCRKKGDEKSLILSMFRILIALVKCRLDHKVKILACDAFGQKNVRRIYEAFRGLFCNVSVENRNISGRVMHTDVNIVSNLAEQLAEELALETADHEVEYQAGRRFAYRMREYHDWQKESGKSFVQNGRYLITGGCGGLGYQIAQYLAGKYAADLVLVGRSESSSKTQSILEDLRSRGGKAEYIKADVSRDEDCRYLQGRIQGTLNGIIHTAGVVRDTLLVNKKEADIEAVLAPKVFGSRLLAENLGEKVSDFMIFFSSMTSVVGNAGQSDYGYANSYMDAYARELNANNYRYKAISIHWPLWKNGGMKMNVQTEQMMDSVFGIKPIELEQGIRIMETAMEQGYDSLIPFYGSKAKIKVALHKQDEKASRTESAADRQSDHVEYSGRFEQDVVDIITGVLKLEPGVITVMTSMDEYGFDSISYTELSNAMNEKFDLGLTPTVFFGCATPKEIASNLVEEYSSEIVQFYEESTSKLNGKAVPENKMESVEIYETYHENNGEADIFDALSVNEEYEPIAIIGYSCKMPDSDSGEEFWEHIKAGKDLVTEIPENRWDWKEYYSEEPTDEFKTNVKYGAFMRNIDQFDPVFFKIAGLDTELMDPQERLVLENAWCAIEDAGYKVSELSDSNTGVFIGVSTADYKELLIENQVTTILSQAFIANRVSYVFNLKGPSEPVDTACSSSLVAIHRAIEQIHNGTCDMALAGGVNVITCPNLYVTQTKAGMLAKDGRCKTFDQSADGYGRGEGCGVILLKPLRKAAADHDHIYGVIRGSAVGHGGHGNNIFSPNVAEQAKVIEKAWEVAQINPLTLSYIEAHGTGTSLGDPIEIDGIKKALKKVCAVYHQELPADKTIGISTVKTNIGHLEAASGIAGLIKVLLCFKYQMIPRTVHFQKLNPYIELDGTPLYIVDQNREWKRLNDNDGNDIPRRAGVSSFGIGGVNAHLVVEEYNDKEHDNCMHDILHYFPVSAKSQRTLKKAVANLGQYLEGLSDHTGGAKKSEISSKLCRELAVILGVEEKDISMDMSLDILKSDLMVAMQCQQMLAFEFHIELSFDWIQECKNVEELVRRIYQQTGAEEATEVNASDIAYTLQYGREAMEERVVFLARDLIELKEKFKVFSDHEENVNGIVRGRAKQTGAKKDGSLNKLRKLYNDEKYEEVAMAWVTGDFDDWSQLYEKKSASLYRVSLPHYPFERESYWIPEGKSVKKSKPGTQKIVGNAEKEKQQDEDGLLKLLKQMETESKMKK